MTKEQIDKLEFLFERRKEIQAFVNCNSNICRIKFNDNSPDSSDKLLWERVKMIHAEDFKQDVVVLARKYLASINEQIGNVITNGK